MRVSRLKAHSLSSICLAGRPCVTVGPGLSIDNLCGSRTFVSLNASLRPIPLTEEDKPLKILEGDEPMVETLSQHLTTIILAALALLAGITLTVTIVRKSKKSSNKVTQTGNKVGGDLAGRDINKR